MVYPCEFLSDLFIFWCSVFLPSVCVISWSGLLVLGPCLMFQAFNRKGAIHSLASLSLLKMSLSDRDSLVSTISHR
jgi:hypothetical protein